jgi:hypothetical protein
MKVTTLTRDVLRFRRQRRRLEADGYTLLRDFTKIMSDHQKWEGRKIVDCMVAVDGLHIYYKIGSPDDRHSA